MMVRVSGCPRLAPLLLLVMMLQLLSQPAVTVKPGTCPKLRPGTVGLCVEECTNDEACPGDQKCCGIGCGKICKEPVPASRGKPGTCPAVNSTQLPCPKVGDECELDLTCQGSNKCCFTGCIKECTKPMYRKPGLCPYVDNSILICPRLPNGDKCQKDWECPGQEKCCSTGCVKVCQKPVKLGACPLEEDWYCIRKEASCSRDSDCDGKEKCCSLSCGSGCVEPEPCSVVKDGSCPIKDYSEIRCFRYQHDCINDAQCPNNEKCCRVKCGTGCVDPV